MQLPSFASRAKCNIRKPDLIREIEIVLTCYCYEVEHKQANPPPKNTPLVVAHATSVICEKGLNCL